MHLRRFLLAFACVQCAALLGAPAWTLPAHGQQPPQYGRDIELTLAKKIMAAAEKKPWPTIGP